MDSLRNLLIWNASARDPFFLGLVAAIMILLAILLVSKPRLYLPLILFTAPLPKLFTIAKYDVSYTTAAPGFSVVDMVLAAGIAGLLFRRWRRTADPVSRAFGRAMTIWSASVMLSVFVGFVVWSGTYQAVFAVYAVRYILTLASFVVAGQYTYTECSDRSLRKILHGLAIAGNITILLGLVYYISFGSSDSGSKGVTLWMTGDNSVALNRTFFWFFDYGNDMGYYAALIGILDIILLSDRRLVGLRLLTAIGLVGCVATILLIGERADVLVLVVAVGYLLWETSKFKHRSVKVSFAFQFVCLAAVVLAFVATMSIIAPEFISKKFQRSSGEDENRQASLQLMMTVGVPDGIAEAVSSLPIGDFALRFALNVSGVWYFMNHPEGVGYWGQLAAAGFYSHHEFVTVLIEQGFPGLAALFFFMVRLKRLLWSARNQPGAAGQLNVLLRTISVGLFAAMVGANTVILDMKFMLVYWALVGVWSVIPRDVRQVSPAILVAAPPRRVAARV